MEAKGLMEESEPDPKQEQDFEIGKDTRKEGPELEIQDDKERQEPEEVGDENILRILDSTDNYLTLLHSLSSTLRQGWLELASARHSMGASRINGALLDLKFHSAATSLQVTQGHDENEPHFVLSKWASLDNGKCSSEEQHSTCDKLQENSGNPQLDEEIMPNNGALPKVDDQVQNERSKSLSVFGTLVSPKLRAAQLSFETALETLVEVANMRSAMLSGFNRVHIELKGLQSMEQS